MVRLPFLIFCAILGLTAGLLAAGTLRGLRSRETAAGPERPERVEVEREARTLPAGR